MKQNDLGPVLAYQLIDPDGSPAQLSGTAVYFNMKGKILRGACTITDAAQGEVEYTWQPGDTSDAGFFQCEFEVVYPVNKPTTYPSKGYITILIEADLG